MCGIAGLIDRAEPEGAEHHLAGMLQRMMARGPDGEGRFVRNGIALGMRRLAVVDLEGGSQPFFAADERVVAFQNGEIYDHARLRSELQSAGAVFRSRCDTEVIPHGYVAWGLRRLLRELDGMFAIAILDEERRRLILARDPFGEKPLYFASSRDRFAYASDLRAVAALPWVDRTLEPSSMARYLLQHSIPNDRSAIRGVSKVPPGGFLELDLETMRYEIGLYHSLRLDAPVTSAAELQSEFETAVTSRMRADVPVGIFLSGGLDSSLVAAVAAAHHPSVATFSIGFDSGPHDERPHAAIVADHIGATHHEFLFRQEEFLDLIPRVVDALDEPLGDQACLPLYLLSKAAREHVTVVLSGEGADEIFAGYGYYRNRVAGLPQDLDAAWATAESWSGFPLLTTPREIREWMHGYDVHAEDGERATVDWLRSARTPLRSAMAADLSGWLADDLLVKLDRMTMAHSLEGRVPFLRRRLVELAFRLGDGSLMDRRSDKIALRRLANRWIPEGIGARRKQGFVLPMAGWLASWFERAGGVEDYFAEDLVDCIDSAAIARMVADELQRGFPRQRVVFAIVMLWEWARRFRSLATT